MSSSSTYPRSVLRVLEAIARVRRNLAGGNFAVAIAVLYSFVAVQIIGFSRVQPQTILAVIDGAEPAALLFKIPVLVLWPVILYLSALTCISYVLSKVTTDFGQVSLFARLGVALVLPFGVVLGMLLPIPLGVLLCVAIVGQFAFSMRWRDLARRPFNRESRGDLAWVSTLVTDLWRLGVDGGLSGAADAQRRGADDPPTIEELRCAAWSPKRRLMAGLHVIGIVLVFLTPLYPRTWTSPRVFSVKTSSSAALRVCLADSGEGGSWIAKPPSGRWRVAGYLIGDSAHAVTVILPSRDCVVRIMKDDVLSDSYCRLPQPAYVFVPVGGLLSRWLNTDVSPSCEVLVNG